MKIKKIEIKNFRILEDISIDFDENVTLVVGRNNTGKTSLSEIFYKFLNTSISNKFKFEDFSLNSCSKLKTTESLYSDYQEEKNKGVTKEILLEKEILFQKTFPKIELNIYIEYEEEDNLSSASAFIMDLDPARKDVLISCNYEILDHEKAMKLFIEGKKESEPLVQWLKNNYAKVYSASYYAVNAVDITNKSKIEESPKVKISDIFVTQFITAQRILDDQSIDDTKGLTKGFGDYYKHNNESANTKDLELLLETTSKNLDGDYKKFFENIFTDLKDFGFNTGLNIQEIEIKSKFDLEKVLKDNATLYYKCDDELLPESHNGLGYSNLIYIILQFFNSFEEYSKRKPIPNFSLLFLEEPEAHLHPQMQQTFIKNVKSFIAKKNWNVQVVITTHSPHIVADSGLENIRYFEKTKNIITVKNLSNFQKEITETDPSAIKFLKQYMTLYNCDMFFADKIIMVEGVVERLLLPEMIKQTSPDLQNQYVSLIEVGGAYAYKFKALLTFLNIKTIIITDIDSVNAKSKSKCPTNQQDCITCNQSLIQLFPKKQKIVEFLETTDSEKILGNIKVSFQTPEVVKGKCGRSFEEAFILKNAKLLSEITKPISTTSLFSKKTETEIMDNSYDIADKITKKTDFAFDIITIENWETPLYIKDSLIWLNKD